MKNNRLLPNLEHDYRVFLWFLTITTAGFYAWSVTSIPGWQQNLLPILVGTPLVILFIALHWYTDKVAKHPRLLPGYILLQGALAFTITLLSNAIVMNFALFLGLVGESIGMMGLSRRGLISCVYYLVLSLISFTLLTDIGGAVWWLVATVPAVTFITIYVTLYNRQTEANDLARELLAELESANQQMSEYAAQVEDLTIAGERQRMARELHDTLSQGLAGLILQLEAADAHLTHDNPDKARQIVQQTMSQARITLQEARLAIEDLRGTAAHTLEENLHRAVDRFSTAAGIPCVLEMDLPDEIPTTQQEAIARILPEALTNIQQHAQAAQVWVNLCGVQDGVRLEINDNGIGFDAATTLPGHYGLIGMRERAQLAGGRLEIESQPGAGTRLVVHFPGMEGQA